MSRENNVHQRIVTPLPTPSRSSLFIPPSSLKKSTSLSNILPTRISSSFSQRNPTYLDQRSALSNLLHPQKRSTHDDSVLKANYSANNNVSGSQHKTVTPAATLTPSSVTSGGLLPPRRISSQNVKSKTPLISPYSAIPKSNIPSTNHSADPLLAYNYTTPNSSITIPQKRANYETPPSPKRRQHTRASLTPRSPNHITVLEPAAKVQNEITSNQQDKAKSALEKFRQIVFYFSSLKEADHAKFLSDAKKLGAKVELSFPGETTVVVIGFDSAKLNEHAASNNANSQKLLAKLKKLKEDGYKVWTRDKYVMVVNQITTVLKESKKSLNEILAEEKLLGPSTGGTADQLGPNYHYFSYPYVHLEDTSQQYKPIIADEFKDPPRLFIKNAIGHCPFIEYIPSEKEKTEDLGVPCENLPPAEKSTEASTVARLRTNSNASGLVSGSVAMKLLQVKKHQIEKLEQREVQMGNGTAAKNGEEIRRPEKRPRSARSHGRAFYRKPGYCENCNKTFDELLTHIKTECHRQYAQNETYFTHLDTVLSKVQRPPMIGPFQQLLLSEAKASNPTKSFPTAPALTAKNTLDEVFPVLVLDDNKGRHRQSGSTTTIPLPTRRCGSKKQNLEIEKVKKDEILVEDSEEDSSTQIATAAVVESEESTKEITENSNEGTSVVFETPTKHKGEEENNEGGICDTVMRAPSESNNLEEENQISDDDEYVARYDETFLVEHGFRMTGGSAEEEKVEKEVELTESDNGMACDSKSDVQS